MRLNIKKIEIQNFRSIQNKVTLEIRPGLFSIEGINMDEESSGNGCFTGDTLISTINGPKQIKDITKDDIVYTKYTKDIKQTKIHGSFLSKYTDTLIELTLDSGKIIKCTPDHKFVITNPKLNDKDIIWERSIAYKEAQNLTEYDELEDKFYGYIYKITCLKNNKIYIGSKKAKRFVEDYWSSSLNEEYWKDLDRYGKENFKREIIEWVVCKNNRELVEIEKKYFKELTANIPRELIYNNSVPNSQVLWTKEMLEKRSAKVIGRPCKEETKEKIRLAHKKRSERLGLPIIHPNKTGWRSTAPKGSTMSELLKGHPSWNNWKANGFATPEFSRRAGKIAWKKDPEGLKQKAIKSITTYNKSEKGRNTSRKMAENMRRLKMNKSPEEKMLIRLKQSLGGLKRKNGILSKQYLARVEEIRKFEPDYDPNETPKQRYARKKCELLKNK